MSRVPFRFEPVTIEFVWQVALVVLALVAAVRFVSIARPALRKRAWLAAAVALPWLVLLTHVLRRAWPRGWRVLFIVLAAAVVYAFSALTYRYATRPISRRDRRRLMALRTVALIAAVLALLRPALVKRTVTREKPSLFFLYDTSRSMAIRDGTDGVSRIEELIGFHRVNDSRLARLRRSFEVVEYEMHAEIAPLGTLTPRPTGPATALGPALRRIAERTERRQVAAIVILSDGAHNTGTEPDHVAAILRERKVPLYAVGFGKDVASGQVRDVAVKSVRCNATVFTKNIFPVVGDLTLLGCKGETVGLQLLFDDRVVDETDLAVTEDGETPRVTMSFTPDEIGIHKVTIRAAALPGEIVADNNQASSYINVLAGGLGILYVEGKVRWEYKFLRRTLEASPDFQVTPALILAPLGPGRQGRLPEDLFDWNRYECIILGDVKPDVFTAEQLETLKTAVSDGGKGLMMIGGYDAFGAGGWHRTPLADSMPVTMDGTDRQVTGLYRAVPTRLAERHFVLQIEEDERASRAAWDRLPELDGASGFADPKPGAEVLATGKDGKPLLVVQNYGRGRSIAFGADSTWRWAFAEADTRKYHKRFWRQVVLWLTRRDKAEGERMWLTLSRQRLKVGHDLEIAAYVQDAVGRPIADCDVRAVVEGPDGLAAHIRLGYQTDAYRITYKPTRRGDYTIKARATRDGKEIGSAEAKFIAYLPDVELEHPLAELDRLRSLASQTEGAFFTPDEAKRLFEALEKRRAPETVIVHTDIIPLWNNWWVLAVFVAALTAEWVLRKRKGMV